MRRAHENRKFTVAELRNLYDHYRDKATDSRSSNPYCLNNEQRAKYDQLREQRNALLSVTPETSKNNGKTWRWREVKRISKQLYELTGHYGYNYGIDT